MIPFPDPSLACNNSGTVWAPFCISLSLVNVSSLNEFPHPSSPCKLELLGELEHTTHLSGNIFTVELPFFAVCPWIYNFERYWVARWAAFLFLLVPDEHCPSLSRSTHPWRGWVHKWLLNITEGLQGRRLKSETVWQWTALKLRTGFREKIFQQLREDEKDLPTWDVAGKQIMTHQGSSSAVSWSSSYQMLLTAKVPWNHILQLKTMPPSVFLPINNHYHSGPVASCHDASKRGDNSIPKQFELVLWFPGLKQLVHLYFWVSHCYFLW